MTRPITIDPGAVYDDGSLSLTLDVSLETLVRARRQRRLRYTRLGRRTLYFGQWVLDWLRSDIHEEVSHGHA